MFTSLHARSEVAWAAFARLKEDEAFIDLYESGDALPAVTIPRQTFDDVSRREFLRCGGVITAGREAEEEP